MAVPGLVLLEDYLTNDAHARLLEAVDQAPWRDDLDRRVQHYGYRYDYKKRAVDSSMRLGPLPAWSLEIAGRLHAEGWMEAPPDQLIVNEYLPGQGITPHIDCVPCFGPTVISLSLGSSCAMELREPKSGAVEALVLRPRSLLVLRGEARSAWSHAIPRRKSDVIDGARVPRGRRVSLTFRTVILAG